ncbi:MAG: stage II sporulation protein D [Bacilli bacterium]|nr:stage II sporulation protein D [Bacilli bacterium]
MIEHYEIRKINKEQILILYLSYDYEFASDFKGNSLLDRINNFIRVSKLKWKGNKIIFVVGGIVLGSLILGKTATPFQKSNQKFDYVSAIILNHHDENNNELGYSKIEIDEPIILEEEIEKNENSETDKIQNENTVVNNNSINQNNNNNFVTKEEIESPSPIIPEEKLSYVTIYRTNGTIEIIELEQYLIGVVAAEMPAAFNIEALKAQSIAARTYALKSIQDGKLLTDNEKTQSYKDIGQLKVMWGANFDNYYNKIKKAVEATKGQVILYNNNYIEALYHSTSNGYTENSYEVFGYSFPYLMGVNSSWDINASSFLRETTFSFEQIEKILGISFNQDTLIEILERNDSGRISRIKIDENYYTGIELRNLLGLRSADFDINVDTDKVVITTRGYGHGVGMSQYGANGMGNIGKTYTEILKHYYPGTTIKTV